MGLYDNIGNAAIGQGGNYLNAGHQYLVEVARVFAKQGRKGDVFTVVELIVHESDDTKNPPGFKASWTVNHKHDAALGNLLWFFGACAGIPVEDEARLKREITTAFCEYAVSAQNPLKGKLVEVEIHALTTRAGNQFSKHVWKPTTRPANPQVAAIVAAQAAAAGAIAAFGTTPAPATQPTPLTQAVPPSPAGVSAPPAGFAAPPLPSAAFSAPPAAPTPPAAPAAKPFPPPGWAPHPSAPGWWFQGQQVLSEAQLRAL